MIYTILCFSVLNADSCFICSLGIWCFKFGRQVAYYTGPTGAFEPTTTLINILSVCITS